MAFSPITSWQIEGEKMEVMTYSFSWTRKSLHMVTAAMKSEDDCFLVGSYDKARQCFEKQTSLC